VAQPLGRYRHRPGPPGVVLGYAALTPDRAAAIAPPLARALGPLPA
jgi:GntR family transcriptional regulator/MocR family aminotransferase